ncbi:hypothetical protein CMV_010479 [Castanea mollissima]|uniref:Uncharacterized protein n=1 Tax=Castanea mollissima TaxID=60419 RepID=A0A8J4W0P9_9ROSI|nr:hypothetical protein CMV_010479 [Castanea mollissima]
MEAVIVFAMESNIESFEIRAGGDFGVWEACLASAAFHCSEARIEEEHEPLLVRRMEILQEFKVLLEGSIFLEGYLNFEDF